jgi:hypothetical protein
MRSNHFIGRRSWIVAVVLLALVGASLACSGTDDLIGQRREGVTPTVAVFATATPGGRISVWLVTPTGQSSDPEQPSPTPFGQVVAPAATATAAFATLRAATATAGATLTGPIYQPSDCPDPGAPLPPPKPASFNQYPEMIGRYLSAGGPTTILESTLRSWGAVTEGAVVQSDTDLTGDGVNDIIVTLYDPALYRAGQPSPGQMLIYGCAQKGYRLLYSTPYGPSTIIPELRRVGDMNFDSRAEVAFTQKTCSGGKCTQAMQIMEWNVTLGAFKPLNDIPMNATDAKIIISDVDKDGVLEVSIVFNPTLDPASGPPRKSVDIWDWDGVSYRLALMEVEQPVYRIHAVHDADYAFDLASLQDPARQITWKDAIRLYDRVRDDPVLLPWTAPDEAVVLRAYATYKKMLAQIANVQTRAAGDTLTTLQTENPAGTPGEGYAIIGQVFMDSYRQTRDRKKACAAVANSAAARPDTLSTLNSYGFNNRTYSLTDLCPFTEK